jgi:hypothetical protein
MEVSQRTYIATPIGEAIASVSQLLKCSTGISIAAEAVNGLIQILDEDETVPEQHALTRRRLSNAQRFLRCGEIGAAEFELSMLVRLWNVAQE